jgi:hypothetical protein
MTSLKITKSYLVQIVAWTVLALVFIFAPGTQETINPYTQPCYPNAQSAKMTLSYENWTDVMTKDDPDFTGPLDRIIPTGAQKGEWVPPGCTAVEDKNNRISVWKMQDLDAPYWIPYTD